MNTKLIPAYDISECLSLKNFQTQKLSKIISAPSPSHHSNCNAHSTMRMNICSLILYLLLLLQNKSLLSINSKLHEIFAFEWPFLSSIAQNTKLAVSDPLALAALPGAANTSAAAPGKVTAMGWPQELQPAPGWVCSLGKGTMPERKFALPSSHWHEGLAKERFEFPLLLTRTLSQALWKQDSDCCSLCRLYSGRVHFWVRGY